MSMAGRMSVFIRLAERTPKTPIRAQRTAIVYGRRSARRTIHMMVRLRCLRDAHGAPVATVAGGRQADGRSPQRGGFRPSMRAGFRLRMTPSRLRQPSFLAVFLVWTAIGLFGLGQSAIVRRVPGQNPLPTAWVVLTAFSVWLWAFYTPVIWWVSERFPFDGKKLRAIAAHVLAAFALLFFEAFLNVVFVMPAIGLTGRKILNNASDLAIIDLVCYAAVVAIEHGRRYRWRSARLESDLRQARLQALEAQLRPHFLFNALNT